MRDLVRDRGRSARSGHSAGLRVRISNRVQHFQILLGTIIPVRPGSASTRCTVPTLLKLCITSIASIASIARVGLTASKTRDGDTISVERAPHRQNPYNRYSPPNQTHPHNPNRTTGTTLTIPPSCTLTIDTTCTSDHYNRYNRFAQSIQPPDSLQSELDGSSREVVTVVPIVSTIPTRVS